MTEIESLLMRWRIAGVLGADAEARIHAFEDNGAWEPLAFR